MKEQKCECGAVCKDPKDLKRFQRRHPKMCQERKTFAQQLAQEVRCVEDSVEHDDSHSRVKHTWDPSALAFAPSWERCAYCTNLITTTEDYVNALSRDGVVIGVLHAGHCHHQHKIRAAQS